MEYLARKVASYHPNISSTYQFNIELHADGPEAYQTFIFEKEPSQEELKLKIGQWMLEHADEFVKMIAPHFMTQPHRGFEGFRSKYEGALDTLGLDHDFHDRPARTWKEQEMIVEINIEILKLMIKEYLKPEEVYFCLLPWMYGSDYRYYPRLEKVPRNKITFF